MGRAWWWGGLVFIRIVWIAVSTGEGVLGSCCTRYPTGLSSQLYPNNFNTRNPSLGRFTVAQPLGNKDGVQALGCIIL